MSSPPYFSATSDDAAVRERSVGGAQKGRLEAAPRYVNLLLLAAILVYAATLIARPEPFLADDCYFYYQIGYNFAHGLGSTFNEVTLANGYHPLWMLVCAAVFATGVGKPLGLHLIAAVIVALNVGVLALLWGALRRIGVTHWQLSAALLIAFLFTTQLGSEGALSGFFLSATLYAGVALVQRFSASQFVLTNVLLDLSVLSRLDNVFICALIGAALLVFALRQRRISQLIWPFAAAGLLHAAILGSYLATNLIFFDSLLPVSGMIKNNENDAHTLFSNVGSVGRMALPAIVACLSFLLATAYRKYRDLLNYLLLPFALGVLIHAIHITFFMSNETQWSWYYTSWTILACVLLAIVAEEIVARAGLDASRLRAIELGLLAATCAIALARVASSVPRALARPSDAPWVAELEAAVPAKNGVKRILTFDLPGRLAYFSSMQVVAADGLTQDLKFQRDIAREGMRDYLANRDIKVFVGLPLVVDPAADPKYCDKMYNGSTRFTCDGPPRQKTPEKVEFYARLPFKQVGEMNLPRDGVIWSGKYAAWKID